MHNTTPTVSRRIFVGGALGAAGVASLPSFVRAAGADSEVRVAVIGFNGRGAGHIGSLLAIPGVKITALCDVDQKVLDKGVASVEKKQKGLKPKAYTDYRQLVQDKDIDAVTIATPNHSHTLIALTAFAAGKHVYVEKPVCHNPMEGRKLVEAAAKRPNQILQHGMQRRSSPGWAEAMEFVKSGQIGNVTLSRGINYKARKSIGKVAEPTQPDAAGRIAGTFRDTGGKPQVVDVDYKLWSAPRPVQPMQREQFHYDWHWQWAYGNGDLGNQGPHQLDVARWALGNPAALPKRVMSFGGRWGYQDDGQTANNQMAFYNYEPAPMLFDNRGLPMKDMNWAKGYEPIYNNLPGKIAAARIGNVIHCQGGFIGESTAYDNEGKKIKKFDNFNDGTDHMLNFISSIRAGKLVNENLHISHGYHAACLAHLANISFRLGAKMSNDQIKERLATDKAGLETFDHFVANLEANKVNLTSEQVVAGPWLDFDPVSEKFTGQFAYEANKLLTNEYAPGFELPEIS